MKVQIEFNQLVAFLKAERDFLVANHRFHEYIKEVVDEQELRNNNISI